MDFHWAVIVYRHDIFIKSLLQISTFYTYMYHIIYFENFHYWMSVHPLGDLRYLSFILVGSCKPELYILLEKLDTTVTRINISKPSNWWPIFCQIECNAGSSVWINSVKFVLNFNRRTCCISHSSTSPLPKHIFSDFDRFLRINFSIVLFGWFFFHF